MLKPLAVACIGLALAIAPLPVHASGALFAPEIDPKAKARAQALYKDGATAYRLTRFAEAVAKFEAAYAEVPLPTFLYNIGLSYKRLFETTDEVDAGKKGKAVLENFKIELQKDPDLGDEAEIDKLIAELDARLADVKAQRDLEAERNRQAELEKARASNKGEPVKVDRGPDPGRTMRIAGASTIGVGGAVLVTGIIVTAVFAARGTEASQEAENATNDGNQELADQWTREGRAANRNAVIGGVVLGLGAVVAIAGIPLLVIGSSRTNEWRKGGKAAHMQLAPYGGRGQFGLTLQGRF